MCSLSSKNLYSLCMLHVLDVVVLKDRQQRLLPASIPMSPLQTGSGCVRLSCIHRLGHLPTWNQHKLLGLVGTHNPLKFFLVAGQVYLWGTRSLLASH